VAFIPTKTLCKGKCDEGMNCTVIKACKCVKVTYLGAYESNNIAYEAAKNYIAEHKLEVTGEPWEEYENDPMEVKDPSKFITNVYWPIK
jgi:effector-binding domain-containing protein